MMAATNNMWTMSQHPAINYHTQVNPKKTLVELTVVSVGKRKSNRSTVDKTTSDTHTAKKKRRKGFFNLNTTFMIGVLIHRAFTTQRAPQANAPNV